MKTSDRSRHEEVAAVIAAVLIVLLAGGCLGTRAGRLGRLPADEALVTLIVSEDRRVVAFLCSDASASAPVLGCHISSPAALPNGRTVTRVTIVRYTDALPSDIAFEIDVHELCHAVDAIQALDDPCHRENGGVLRSAVHRPRTSPR